MKKLAVVRNSLGDELTIEDFKAKFLELHPIPYDIYEGEKGKLFDKWITKIIPSLPKKKT